jgi:tripartite-type tricarboxylate transporter receptor subunit TctC
MLKRQMMRSLLRGLGACAAVLCAALCAESVLCGAQGVQGAPAALQALRSRPLRIAAASGPGGGSDITARYVAKTMGELLRQTVLVENRPRADSSTGTEYAARATPDGHTLLVTTGSSMVMNGLLY